MTQQGNMGDATARSIKRMKTTAAVQTYQKEYFAQLQYRASQGEPVLFMGANTPHEIAEAMDIPLVVDTWWMAINAAKRLTGYYRDLTAKERAEKGYNHFGMCGRCGGNWTQLAEQDPDHSAYGGLPKLTAIIQAENACSASIRASQLELRDYRKRGFDVPVFSLESTAPTPYPNYPNWWEKIEDHWDEVIEPYRLDYRVEEYKSLIKFLEIHTGRTFSRDRLAEVMELVNEQEHYWRKARDLIAKTIPSPIDVVDQVGNYPNQWHRGTTHGRDLAKMFYEEVKEKVENGEAAYPDEKFRLQWLKAGNWGDTALYQYFAEKYGAVFISTIYLSIASDGYPRNCLGDPLRALASRHVFLGLYAGTGWDLKEARLNKIDAALMFENTCPSSRHMNHLQTQLAFEAAGIPIFLINPAWDPAQMRVEASNFIEKRLLSK
jgi:hypothetical protein